ncbi:RagB/SusD family nutrient uptake outer membrane protein [Anseongella ginsenosidimutans]|uniref:RagB/SusD family nutrient uptake outer membrane protein n=1 Tax=Anseongella ginsenosidimutans TaxID=496056 RepID=UPI001CEFA69E|nr:RagB/SusD family nutrient uptake outer membrane protein [Anseongella ginsenosidimutans]
MPFNIARGNQNVVDPYNNYWDGRSQAEPLFRGIRDCNIFLEKIHEVPDIDDFEKHKWMAEVNFLKAYFHFYLLRMYGPIPIMDENLPITSGTDAVKVERQHVDTCFNYIVNLLDKAAADLPEEIELEAIEAGRITKPIAKAVKAKVLIYAASPLFNGNKDYTGYVGNSGEQLFDPQYSVEKWERAAEACKEAIELSHATGHELFYWQPNQPDISEQTIAKMHIRNSVTEEWNREIIWSNTNSMTSFTQWASQARLVPEPTANIQSLLAPTMRMAELFYTENGVPITEDKTWDYAGRFQLRTATPEEKYLIKEGYQTVALHFQRETRFYASLAFDGAIWYGQGRFNDDDPFYVQAKMGQNAARKAVAYYSVTGYWPKKLVNFNNPVSLGVSYAAEAYPWPEIRLADLYLLYAEALNETNGPGPEPLKWINLVRERASLKTVEESWSAYSKTPGKYQNQNGLREIIHQERMIEMAFEGQRFWDLRRWKKAEQVMNSPIRGWTTEEEEATGYYQVQTLFNQAFQKRDYFWPIREQSLIENEKLIQSPGW